MGAAQPGAGLEPPTRFRGGRSLAVGAVYAVSATFCCLLAAFSAARFVDLHVYRLGGQAVLDGTPLYRFRYAGLLPFTYPPAAALVFTVLAVAPWTMTAAMLTAAGAVAFPAALYFALRLPPVTTWLDRGSAGRLALAVGAAVIWLEPVRTTLAYGQVNVLLTLLILYDLSRPDGARLKGAGIGLAAGIKLTPAIFAVYLLATRRYRAAAVAGGVFATTIAAGYVVQPGSSAAYWDGTFLNPAHVGEIQQIMNQSLLGMLARALRTATVTPGMLAVVALTGTVGLALATRAGRAGDEALGFSLCAVTMLLVSPISWTHHWVIAIPALVLGVLAAWRRWLAAWQRWLATRRRWLATRRRWPVAQPGAQGAGIAPGGHGAGIAPGGQGAGLDVVAALAVLAVLAGVAAVGWSRLVRQIPNWQAFGLSPLHFVYGDAYVLIGLCVLAVAAWPVAAAQLWRARRGYLPLAGRRPRVRTGAAS
jgi:alpha-1,2-mannosyltransferase